MDNQRPLPFIDPNSPPDSELLRLARHVVEVLDNRCKAGCTKPDWTGYENGNGQEVGRDIERLIKRCKRIINNPADYPIRPPKPHKTSLFDLFSSLTPSLEDDSMRDVLLQDNLQKLLGTGYEDSSNEAMLVEYARRQYEVYQRQRTAYVEQWADAAPDDEGETEAPPFVPPAPSIDLVYTTGMLATTRKRHFADLAFQVYHQEQEIKSLNDWVSVVEQLGQNQATERAYYKVRNEEMAMELEIARLKIEMNEQVNRPGKPTDPA